MCMRKRDKMGRKAGGDFPAPRMKRNSSLKKKRGKKADKPFHNGEKKEETSKSPGEPQKHEKKKVISATERGKNRRKKIVRASCLARKNGKTLSFVDGRRSPGEGAF